LARSAHPLDVHKLLIEKEKIGEIQLWSSNGCQPIDCMPNSWHTENEFGGVTVPMRDVSESTKTLATLIA
jgi:hypothetical protein